MCRDAGQEGSDGIGASDFLLLLGDLRFPELYLDGSNIGKSS